MKIILYQSNLQFEYPFTIAKGTKTHQPSLIICIEHDGIQAFGEAPAIKYYNISIEQMVVDIKLATANFNITNFENAADVWAYFNKIIAHNNFALCALDMAIHDWFCKKNKLQLFESFGVQWLKIPATDYTLGFDSMDMLAQKIKQHPMPIYKIKLGLGNEENVLQKITELTSSKIRIDFNEGLTADRFIELYPLFKKYNIELLEQPLHKTDTNGMNAIKQISTIDLFADEFCVVEKDVWRCVNLFDGINIKLTKCGGITPALRMIQTAKQLNLKVMMGSMNESSIGTAAIAHFLPLLDKVDMDGFLLLRETFASGIEIDKNAICQLPKGWGLGVQVDLHELSKYTIADFDV